jgi:PhzF family phenazine biosynthesis protein
MKQWIVDAFAPAPFMGNQAAVVAPLDGNWPETAALQRLAMENNLAETAYLKRTEDPARFALRWFTPAIEVPLCGHATLAAAHVLFDEMMIGGDKLTFDSLSGALTVRRVATGYELDFPARPNVEVPAPDGLAAALGAAPLKVLSAEYLMAEFADGETVRSLRPDIGALSAMGLAMGHPRPGNVICAGPDLSGQYDLIVRFFAPGSGIPEDPATGSAQCQIVPHFTATLNRSVLRSYQAYPGRGAVLEGEMAGTRVRIRGQALTMAEAQLRFTL